MLFYLMSPVTIPFSAHTKCRQTSLYLSCIDFRAIVPYLLYLILSLCLQLGCILTILYPFRVCTIRNAIQHFQS
jgi:hypothetical protein